MTNINSHGNLSNYKPLSDKSATNLEMEVSMATQGLVTVVHAGKVVMKIVVGSNGMKAQTLAKRVKNAWPVSAEKAYEIAVETGFGCQNCRVVITPTRTLFYGDGGLRPLYRKTFQQPCFNPRWKYGTADHIIVINV
ncbi:MAG: hypothetical protein ABIH38_04640 [Patescibacteria group bacterium]